MLDDLFDMFSQRSGLSSNIARMVLPMVSRFMLRNAEPQRASGLLSLLPSDITNIFSNDERQRFTTTQENVSEDEVIDQISRECCNGDKEKGRIAYQEAIKVLREKTARQKQQQGQQGQQQQEGQQQEREEDGEGGFLDNIFDSLKERGKGLF